MLRSLPDRWTERYAVSPGRWPDATQPRLAGGETLRDCSRYVKSLSAKDRPDAV